jgi:hypothetical protein
LIQEYYKLSLMEGGYFFSLKGKSRLLDLPPVERIRSAEASQRAFK